MHLRPIHSLEMLAASYGRESAHTAYPGIGVQQHGRVLLRRSATEVAYALRWLELTCRLDPRPWREYLQPAGAPVG